jgi:hypothetical protein
VRVVRDQCHTLQQNLWPRLLDGSIQIANQYCLVRDRCRRQQGLCGAWARHAVLATITVDEKRDRALRCIDAHHLFASSLLSLAVRRNGYLRRYLLVLISMLAPHLGMRDIERALAGDGLPERPLPER